MSYYDQADTFFEDYDYAFAAKKSDPPAPDEPNIMGLFHPINVDPSKSNAQKESEVIKAQQKQTQQEAAKKLNPTDKDCANWLGLGGILDGLCTAGKSIIKGGQSAGDFFKNPTTWIMVAAAVIIFIVIILKVK